MILEARWAGQKTVKAKGPPFDLDRVQAANLVIVRKIISVVQERNPKERPFCRPFGWKAMREYDEAGEQELLDLYDELRDGLYDVADFPFRVEVGPYKIDVCPLGGECLRRKDGKLTVLGAPERPAFTLDVRPTLFIHGAHRMSVRWASLGEMDGDERRTLSRVLSGFRTSGVQYDRSSRDQIVPPVVKVKLSHDRYGDVERPEIELRIRCVERE